ncbi:hypothetical protein Tco_0570232 [Tanacetum coccineum]
MDDPNITLEEFIRLEEEKARRHGRTFNWQTATFEKVKNYEDEDDCFIDFKTEFPAIVFDNTALRSEPIVCPPNENKVDFRISLDESDDEDYTIEEYTEGIRHSYEQRLETIWSRPVNRVHMLDFEGLTPEMRQDLAVRLRMVYFGEGEQVFMSQAWRRLFRIRAPLVCEFILEFLSTCRMSDTEMGLAEEGTQEIPAPAQAPPPPPPASQPRTMSQRIERIEEEMHDLRRDVVGLRGVVESFTTEQNNMAYPRGWDTMTHAENYDMLKKCHGNQHQIGVLPQMIEDGTLEHKPVAILERRLGKLNNKPVMFLEDKKVFKGDGVDTCLTELHKKSQQKLNLLIIEQRVKVNQKARILELKQRDYKEQCSDIPYATSIKEDTAYLCLKLHSASTIRRLIRCIQKKAIRRIQVQVMEYSGI